MQEYQKGKIMFKVINGGFEPTRATKYSAMVDLYAREDMIIGAGETKIVPLGVKIDTHALALKMYECYSMGKHLIDWEREHAEFEFKTHYLELHPRSSLRAKGLIIGVGVIDLDYPDEIGLIVHNPIRSSNTSTFSVIAETVRVTPNLNGVGNGIEGRFVIKKGDKIAQCTLKEHKGYLLGIESDTECTGGFGSTN